MAGAVTNEPLAIVKVANLTASVTEAQLRGLLLAHGHLVSYDRPLVLETGRPGAIAYIEMATADADRAVAALEGHMLGGEALTVTIAGAVGVWAPDADRHPRSPSPRRTVLAPSTAPERQPPEGP